MSNSRTFGDPIGPALERAGSAASTVATSVRDGVVRHRQELAILLATLTFVVIVGLLGAAALASS